MKPEAISTTASAADFDPGVERGFNGGFGGFAGTGGDFPGAGGGNLPLLGNIPVRLSVEVGRTAMRLAELLDLAEGSVVALDRQATDLLDIMANGTLVAKGEVVTINGRYGIRVVELFTVDGAAAGQERRR